MKSKKLLLGSLTAMATVAAPVAAVVSCSGVSYESLAKKIDEVKAEKLADYTKALTDLFSGVKGEDGKDIETKTIGEQTDKEAAKKTAMDILGKAFPKGLKKATEAAKKAAADKKAAK